MKAGKPSWRCRTSPAQSAYLGYVTGTTLEEVKSLSRSMRSLTDYLERHPESLIRGKSTDKGDAR